MDKKLFLIDGHSLIFRMYYAFLRHPMINVKRENVSIIFGFTRYLLELIQKCRPTHMAVCFDPPGKTFRHLMYPDYKATREAAPELVIAALEPLKEMCGAMGLPVLMVPGFEGDDVLAAMAIRSAEEGFDVYMVTPDKDFGQVVGKTGSGEIFQYKPGKSGDEDEILDAEALCRKLGIKRTSQVVDMLAICGDSADNVPGVKGVGEVGAVKLLDKYDTLEGIYEHIDELTPRQKEQFEAARDHIDLSKVLVTIKTDIPLDVTADDMILRQEHSASLARLMDRYDFPSLKKMLTFASGEEAEAVHGTRLEWKEIDVPQFCAKASALKACGIVVKCDGSGIGQVARRIAGAVCDDTGNYVSTGTPEEFRPVLISERISKRGVDLKACDNALRMADIRLGGLLEDVSLMHYVIDPEKNHRLDILSKSYLDVDIDVLCAEEHAEQTRETPGLFDALPQDDESTATDDKLAKLQALAAYQLVPHLKKELSALSMDKLFYQVEEPLQRVLAHMERTGVKVEMAPLREYASSLRKEMAAIEDKVRDIAKDPSLNLSSPRQVGRLLFDKLQIDPRIKKKDVYPTDEETLSNYAESNPVIYDILEYRSLRKLLGTYIEPFGDWISPGDGRIHTTFNQALTSTGRLSSSRPNLQNIPIRTERGREIRKAFVPSSPDNVIVSADYSQIELRLMAHFCGDENMLSAFCRGADVHSITASKIFGVKLDEVTADMRRSAKTANFGIIYGISPFGLSQRLKIPRVAAKKLIEDYFASFPAISRWLEKTKADASRLGYVQTLFGRRRYIPDINSRNATTRGLAERNAINAPIQGTAADIIKMAMIKVELRLRNAAMQSRMVLQIHDELVFDAPRSEVQELMHIIKEEMENVIRLSVPLTVECNYGENWLEAH